VSNVGAFAWDDQTHNYGVSWNQPTSQLADEIALRECGDQNARMAAEIRHAIPGALGVVTGGCKVVAHTGPAAMCGALADAHDRRHAYFGEGRDRDAAARNALGGCGASSCILHFTNCNQ
jgi:hypothetical protein